MADYPVLDEEDYGCREHEANLSNITEAAWRLRREHDLPNGWESAVFSWLSEHNPRAIESRDDRGGYPEDDELRAAIVGLNYPQLK